MIDEREPDEQGEGQAIEPAQDAPLTKETFAAQWQQLIERARAAGLNPIQMLVKAYAKRGEAILGSLLAALEDEDSSKGRKK